MLPAQEQEQDDDVIIEIIGKESFYGVGIYENGNEILVVDSIYDGVTILDEMQMIEAMQYHLVPGDSTTKMPAPVVLYYNYEGELVSRNISLLFEADTDDRFCSRYADKYNVPELKAGVMFREAMAFELAGKNREAYQKYLAISKKYPEMTLAQEKADEIMQNMRDRQAYARQQIAEERARAEAFAASMQELAASINQLGNTIQAASNSRHRHTSAPAHRNTASVQERSSSVSSSSTTSSSNSSTKKSSSTSSTKKATTRDVSSKGSSWCFDKKEVECTLCKGRGKCTFCRDGKVYGYVIRTCDYCRGTGICQRCKGTKTITQ